ncbi:hypothetical protein Ddye_026098 [Dipteronia dyeriana]|uniref:GDSL esterase/lipase n=1 Tax=Dipteronia dyeriana TaxID=168575 RepID=A0AAD9TLI8_9ROSI|nr:hypothetical protein Ddye_026095 [Dipteronia dyeriana]KAK2638303.1 hypothetical protein Ddye_026098 [Dipteronia dyeriana]
MTVAPLAEARAFFVFGDSLVDSGNNNYLATTARADAPPYGIDYPTRRPTGRFSNGLNIPDIIRHKLLNGANFASAGIGILNDTGIQFLNIIRMFRQLDYFEEYQRRVSSLIGAQKAGELVNKALVLITVGGNDFVNNYYLVPFSARSRQFSLPDYVKYLISEYRKLLMVIRSLVNFAEMFALINSYFIYIEHFLRPIYMVVIIFQRLYELGARQVLVTGTGPLGCLPAELAMRSTNGGCSAELQRAVALYNPQLMEMIQGLNSEIGENVFIAANTQQMHMDFISDPQAYGFTTSKIACCGQGPNNGLGLCTVLSNLCPHRDHYAFWDPFHPSEKANKIIVQQIMSGSIQYMTPMNLTTLLANRYNSLFDPVNVKD